jgi:hypothetical protein
MSDHGLGICKFHYAKGHFLQMGSRGSNEQLSIQVLALAAFHFLMTPGLTGAEAKSPPNMLSSSFGEYLQHGREVQTRLERRRPSFALSQSGWHRSMT